MQANIYVLAVAEGDDPVDLSAPEVQEVILGGLAGSVEVLDDWVTVIAGNPVDGFSVNGIFGSSAEAVGWAEKHVDGDWWVAPIRDTSKGGG